jgi:signal transduction histidine kinase
VRATRVHIPVRVNDDDRVQLYRHDLRSALSVIYGFARLLERRDDEALRLEAAGRIQQAAAVLEKLVVSLLDELEVTLAESPYEP